MAERRSLGQAMTMSPEKMAFIKGSVVSKVAAPAVDTAPSQPKEKIIEVGDPGPAKEALEDGKARTVRKQSRPRSTQHQPEASEILDQVLVPVTIRLQHRTAQALRRAHLEQRLRHAKPDTQQEIAEEALGEWLSRQGFLD